MWRSGSGKHDGSVRLESHLSAVGTSPRTQDGRRLQFAFALGFALEESMKAKHEGGGARMMTCDVDEVRVVREVHVFVHVEEYSFVFFFALFVRLCLSPQ